MSDPHPAMNASSERGAWSTSGYIMLLVFLALVALTIWRTVAIASGDSAGLPFSSLDSDMPSFLVFTGLRLFALILIASGFYMIQPNQAVAITLFGSYRGTDRNTGLRWCGRGWARPRFRCGPIT